MQKKLLQILKEKFIINKPNITIIVRVDITVTLMIFLHILVFAK